MNVYLVCWFDRHSDPFIKVFANSEDANVQLEECMGWRTYEYIDSKNEETEDDHDYKWVWEYSAYRFVKADIDDGPHGYILEQPIIGG